MGLKDDLLAADATLKDEDFLPITGFIVLQDDSDDEGAFIAQWNSKKTIPKGFKVGK